MNEKHIISTLEYYPETTNYRNVPFRLCNIKWPIFCSFQNYTAEIVESIYWVSFPLRISAIDIYNTNARALTHTQQRRVRSFYQSLKDTFYCGVLYFTEITVAVMGIIQACVTNPWSVYRFLARKYNYNSISVNIFDWICITKATPTKH